MILSLCELGADRYVEQQVDKPVLLYGRKGLELRSDFFSFYQQFYHYQLPKRQAQFQNPISEQRDKKTKLLRQRETWLAVISMLKKCITYKNLWNIVCTDESIFRCSEVIYYAIHLHFKLFLKIERNKNFKMQLTYLCELREES